MSEIIQQMERPVSWFEDALRTGKSVSFSRWGDGEWNSVLNLRSAIKVNVDGQHYFPKLGEKLREVLERRPTYALGIQNLAIRCMGDLIEKYLRDTGLATNLRFSDADIFHKASVNGRFLEFMRLIRQLQEECKIRLIFAGPVHLRSSLSAALAIQDWVEVPSRDSFLAYAKNLSELQGLLNRHLGKRPKTQPVVLFSNGMVSNVLIDALYRDYGDRVSLLDMGSVFDPYCGKQSRKYHANLDLSGWQEKL